MRNEKAIFGILALFVVMVAPLCPCWGESSKKCEVSGKVEILSEGGGRETVWVKIAASEVEGECAGEGRLRIWLEDDDSETVVEFAYMRADGNYAWLAGECTKDSDGMEGRWLFVVVHDGGEPGRLVDHIWLEWLETGAEGEAVAQDKVKNLEKPAEGRSIKDGNIVVEYET